MGLLCISCTGDFASIEDACSDRVPGQGAFDSVDELPVLLGREVNCVRRYAGLSRISVDADLSGASAAHARYLDWHGADGSDTTSEQAELEGFTGVDPIARGEAFGYRWGETLFGFWESSLEPAYVDADRWVSRMLHDPFTRQVLLQPSLHTMGAGNGEDWTVTDWHYAWPPSERARRPITWPVDGARDIPVSAPARQADGSTVIAGYAPSITLGAVSADPEAANPIGIVVRQARMEGPEGQVEFSTARPERGGAAMPFSVALIPENPLVPNASYTVSVDLTWDNRETSVEWQFSTGSEAVEP